MTTNSPVADPATNRVDYYNAAANRVAIFDSAKATHLATLPANPIGFSAKGQRLATLTASNEFSLWDTQNLLLIVAITPWDLPSQRSLRSLKAAGDRVALTPDGTRSCHL